MPRNNAFLPATIERLGSVRGLRKLDDPETRGLSIELIRSDKRRWLYRRRIPATNVIVTICGGLFPAVSIGDARQWATRLNAQVEAGIDPRAVEREARAILPMTVGRAHGLYMTAVREGRASGVNRPNKPRTIQDKIYIYQSDIAPALADTLIHEVTEVDLVTLVLNKGKRAKIARQSARRGIECFLRMVSLAARARSRAHGESCSASQRPQVP